MCVNVMYCRGVVRHFPSDDSFMSAKHSKAVNFVFSDTVIGIGVEEEDRKHTWMEDSNSVSRTT